MKKNRELCVSGKKVVLGRHKFKKTKYNRRQANTQNKTRTAKKRQRQGHFGQKRWGERRGNIKI